MFCFCSDLTAHMSRSSWVGLNDIVKEGTFVWSDGTQAVSDPPLNLYIWSHKVRKLREMNNILTVIWSFIVFHVKRMRSFFCSLWPLQDFLPWETNQPDNWQNNEDCVYIRGTEHQDTGKLNDLPCTSTYPFICQKGANNLRFWLGFYLFYCSSSMDLIHGTRAELIFV